MWYFSSWLIFLKWRKEEGGRREEGGGRREEGAHHYFVFLQINWEVYKKTLRRTVFNALVTSLFFQLSIHPLVRWRGIDCGYELPSFPTALWHLFLYLIIVEIGFYYTHRSELINLRGSSILTIVKLWCCCTLHYAMVNTNFMYYAIKFDLDVLHQLQKYKARLGQYQDHVE